MSITVDSLELEDTYMSEMSNVSAGTSHRTVSQNDVVQYEANGENHDTQSSHNEYEEDNNWGREESFEEEYWEQSRPVKKVGGSKKIPPSECCNAIHNNFITYRQTCSKDQKERQINKGYKLDIITTSLVEKLLDVRNFGSYHDALGEGRNSIVIAAGKLVVPYTYQKSLNLESAIKIYKLSNDDAKNKAIFQRTQREYDQMKSAWYTYSTKNIPYTVCYSKNVIVMERVGTDEKPALSITTVPQNLCSEMYDMVIWRIQSVYDTYTSSVHGNLNVKNILCCDGKPFFVGWSHSVCVSHPNALKKLIKDCYFVTKFFERRGVAVKSTEDLFKQITKLKEISSEVLDVLDKRRRATNPNRSLSDVQRLGGNSRFK